MISYLSFLSSEPSPTVKNPSSTTPDMDCRNASSRASRSASVAAASPPPQPRQAADSRENQRSLQKGGTRRHGRYSGIGVRAAIIPARSENRRRSAMFVSGRDRQPRRDPDRFEVVMESESQMRLLKIEIAVPGDLLLEIDHAARMRGESRDRFVTRVLRESVRAQQDAEVTRRLDDLFSEPELSRYQKRVAAELDVAGTNWNDETW